MERPLISVVTVCLDCRDDLELTAHSVIRQKYQDFEYIIKDGDSTDGTKDFLEKCDADKVIIEKDQGIFDAMNQGLKAASGRFIHFLNAGDYFIDDQVLYNVSRVMNKAPISDLYYMDIVHGVSRSGFQRYPDYLSPFFLYQFGLCHQAWFLSREVYSRCGGFQAPHPQFLGDYKILLEAILKKKCTMHHVRRYGVYYDGQGISSSNEYTSLREKLRKEVKKLYFTKSEITLFSVLSFLLTICKRVIYDPFLSHLYRRILEADYLRGKRI